MLQHSQAINMATPTMHDKSSCRQARPTKTKKTQQVLDKMTPSHLADVRHDHSACATTDFVSLIGRSFLGLLQQGSFLIVFWQRLSRWSRSLAKDVCTKRATFPPSPDQRSEPFPCGRSSSSSARPAFRCPTNSNRTSKLKSQVSN